MDNSFTITLSDPGTKEQFKRDETTFKVKHIYHFYKATGYVTKEKNFTTLMLLAKNKNENFLPRVY